MVVQVGNKVDPEFSIVSGSSRELVDRDGFSSFLFVLSFFCLWLWRKFINLVPLVYVNT